MIHRANRRFVRHLGAVVTHEDDGHIARHGVPAHNFRAVHVSARAGRARLRRRENLARRLIAHRRARFGERPRPLAVQTHQLAHGNRIALDAVGFRRQFGDTARRDIHRVIEFEHARAPVRQTERRDELPALVHRHLCARAHLDAAVRTVKMRLVIFHRCAHADMHPRVHPMFEFRGVRKRAVREKFDVRARADFVLGDDFLQALGGQHPETQMHGPFDARLWRDDDARFHPVRQFLCFKRNSLDAVRDEYLIRAHDERRDIGHLERVRIAACLPIRVEDRFEFPCPTWRRAERVRSGRHSTGLPLLASAACTLGNFSFQGCAPSASMCERQRVS